MGQAMPQAALISIPMRHRISLLPKQWEVFNPTKGVDYDIALYQGGFGAGKTHVGAITGLTVLSQNPGATWLVGADTGARLKLTTCETFEEILDAGKIRYNFNRTDKIIRVPGWDDARVIFKGLDDPMALRSVNGIGGHLEEASLLDEASYLEFLGRLRQAKPGTPIRVILTTNPQSTRGWLFDHFVTRAGITIEEIRGKEIRINRRRVVASTLENKHVSDAFIATLKASYDPELYKIVVLGKDGDYTRGLVNSSFSDLNIQDTPYRKDQTLYLTCDFNVDPMSWALAHRYNNEYHFFDEIVIENTTIDECVDEFVRRYPEHESGIVITGDASGNNRSVTAKNEAGTSTVNDKKGTAYTEMLNRFRFHDYPGRVRVDVREANPAISARVNAWNGMVCNTNGIRRVFINPKCKWLLWNCQNLKYKEGSGVIDEPTVKDIEKNPKSKFTKHVWDAASYLVEKYDPIILTNAKPGPSTSVPSALNKHLRGR